MIRLTVYFFTKEAMELMEQAIPIDLDDPAMMEERTRYMRPEDIIAITQGYLPDTCIVSSTIDEIHCKGSAESLNVEIEKMKRKNILYGFN